MFFYYTRCGPPIIQCFFLNLSEASNAHMLREDSGCASLANRKRAVDRGQVITGDAGLLPRRMAMPSARSANSGTAAGRHSGALGKSRLGCVSQAGDAQASPH